MQAKRFIATDMRRALNLVREQMGEDAMILSTQRTNKGVEIVATLDDVPPPNFNNKPEAKIELEKKPVSGHSFADDALLSEKMEKNQSTVGAASGKTHEELAQEIENARRRMLAMQEEEQLTLSDWAQRQTEKSSLQARKRNAVSESEKQPQKTEKSPLPTKELEASREKDIEEIRRLHDEINHMRSMFESQLMAMAEAQQQQLQQQLQLQQNQQTVVPMILEVKQRLSQLGLTKNCSDQLIQSLKSLDDKTMNSESLWSESLARLSRRISSLDDDPVAQGGRFAFLGATGVGKTTTIAKLAARYVLQHGAGDVALLTTDTFRIAAHNQLYSVAKILNVDIQVVDDLSTLPSILEQFSEKSLVLIDTPGMNYNDPLLNRHLSVLQQCKETKAALLLSANSQFQMMQASVHRYRIAKLCFCVMTKLDECASLGDALSLLSGNTIPLAYVTNGQAVPDDLAFVKPHQLVSKAVTLSKRSESMFTQVQPISS